MGSEAVSLAWRRGVRSGDLRYRVMYEDGQFEHFTGEELETHRDPSHALGGHGRSPPGRGRITCHT